MKIYFLFSKKYIPMLMKKKYFWNTNLSSPEKEVFFQTIYFLTLMCPGKFQSKIFGLLISKK